MDSESESESSKPLNLHSKDLEESISSENSVSFDAEVIGDNSISGSEYHSVDVGMGTSTMQSTLLFDSEVFNRCSSGKESTEHSVTSAPRFDGHSSSKEWTEHSETSIPALEPYAQSKSESESSSSVASSSSDASLKPIFQIGSNESTKYKTDIIPLQRLDKDSQLKLRKGEDCSAKISSKVEHDSDCSGATSTSPVSDITHESLLYSMSPTQSPPVQVMDRSAGSEPHRVPSSAFARNKSSSTPAEWSNASNDSLFSIQLGSNSFSRDHVSMLGNDLLRSGELTKSSELFSLSPAPILNVPSKDNKVVHMEKTPEGNTKSVGFASDVKKEIGDNGYKERASPRVVSWNSSQLSDESGGTSAQSFSFPKKKGPYPKPSTRRNWKIFLCWRKMCAWPLCYCSSCNCTSCTFCRWPSCKCPSCYCSKCCCAFCSHWNCSQTRFCCCPSTTLTEIERTPHKLDSHQTHQQPAFEVTTPKPNDKKSSCCFTCCPCHHCFSCCQRRCCCCCHFC